jgi:glycosyltransferase involved in cell wall biosynthesis
MIPMPARLRLAVDGRVLTDRYHGVGRINFELLQRVADHPDLDIVLFLHPEQDTGRFDLSDLLKQPNVDVRHIRSALTSPVQLLEWPVLLRACRADISLFPYHLGSALFGGSRRYSMLHDCIFETDRTFAPNRRTLFLYRQLTRRIVARNWILTPSEASAADIRRYYRRAAHPIAVVPWGVSRLSESDAGSAIALPDRYFLQVGARRPHKNVEFLVRVLHTLSEDEHLVLVGGRDSRFPDQVAAVAGELGIMSRVHHFESVDEATLQAMYSRAQAYLYPSRIEGFGLPLLEAMAAAVPVVASDIPVFREVAGDAAQFAALDDVAAWTEAIRALDDPDVRAAYVERGLRLARGATWRRSADRLLTVLTDDA